MTLVAGLSVGVFAYFVVGFVTGNAPRVRFRPERARPQVSRRQLWLDQAGVGLNPRQFWAASIGVGLMAFAAVWLVTGTPLVALVPAGGVATLPAAYFARRRRTHLRQVQSAWPDGLRDLIASIAAGRSMPQALNSLAVSGPPPLRDAFARFPDLARMLGTVPALEVVKEDLADPTNVNSHPRSRGTRRAHEPSVVPFSNPKNATIGGIYGRGFASIRNDARACNFSRPIRRPDAHGLRSD